MGRHDEIRLQIVMPVCQCGQLIPDTYSSTSCVCLAPIKPAQALYLNYGEPTLVSGRDCVIWCDQQFEQSMYNHNLIQPPLKPSSQGQYYQEVTSFEPGSHGRNANVLTARLRDHIQTAQSVRGLEQYFINLFFFFSFIPPEHLNLPQHT